MTERHGTETTPNASLGAFGISDAAKAACDADYGSSWELCDYCDGTGEKGEWYCPDCKGLGMIEEESWSDDDF